MTGGDPTLAGVYGDEPTLTAFDDEPTLPFASPPEFEEEVPISVDLSGVEGVPAAGDPPALDEVVLRRAQAWRDAHALRMDGAGTTRGRQSLRRW